LAFDSQKKGLNWAIANKDSASIISLLNLKAMLIHTKVEITDGAFKSDSSINLHLAALKIAEASPKFESQRIPFYDDIAEYYLNIKDYEKAVYYADWALALH
jgi:hypothetical protein